MGQHQPSFISKHSVRYRQPKYWLGLDGYCPLPAMLAQQLTDNVSLLACTCRQQWPLAYQHATQKTRSVEPVLVWCWATVGDGGPALDQQLSTSRVCWECWQATLCFAQKRNNKFRLIGLHSLYCPQEPFNYKSQKISYQPLLSCCWSFLFTRNCVPFSLNLSVKIP